MTKEDKNKITKLAYNAGFEAALRAFAWWRDGEQYVGSGVRTLKWALENKERLDPFYCPPHYTELCNE